MMILLVVAIGATLAIAARVVGRAWLVVTVRGTSMSPTLRDGQRLIVRRGRGYASGDIIVFRRSQTAEPPAAGDPPDDPWLRIKRIAAVGGEPIPERLRAGVLASAHDVLAHHVVVSGDNAVSEDSRHLGLVAEDAILGFVRSRRGRGSRDRGGATR